MITVEVYTCNADGSPATGQVDWTGVFEVAPRPGETVRYQDSASDVYFKVLWATHDCLFDPDGNKYQYRIGVVGLTF